MASLEGVPAQSDDSLVREVLGGSRDAYAILVRRYERQAHAAAWAILRDHHAAQDVAQDSFIKAYGQLGQLRQPRTFGIWLLAIARRTAADRVRGKKRLVFVPTVPDTATFDAPAESDADQILTLVASLPSREQQVLLFRYVDSLSVSEIAMLAGSPVGTVTKQLSRALSRLRDRLKETS
jgi:RNA polymerase sigma-70 factor (ECF subfamily)